MKKLLTLALAASLSACAGTPCLDVCKGAEVRRTAYSTAINAVTVLEFSGRPGPQAALIARDAVQMRCRSLIGTARGPRWPFNG